MPSRDTGGGRREATQDKESTATLLLRTQLEPQPERSGRKKKSGTRTGNEEDKSPLFADDTILHLQDPRNPIKRLLELITQFSNVARYEIHTQKSIVLPCTNDGLTERRKENNTITTASRKTKHLGSKRTKKVKGLCSETCNTQKETEEDQKVARCPLSLSGGTTQPNGCTATV